MKRNLLVAYIVMLAIFITACQPVIRNESAVPSSHPTIVVAATPTPPPLQISLSPISTDTNPSAGTIFTKISPSVAFIETPAGTGSGALIDHGFLLSNAHVVWPFDKVRIVFPDGSEYLDVPVYGWDLMADIALIGPIETQISPVELVDAGEIGIGSDVYLIGYPAEVDDFPQPTITSGILSRVRVWDSIDYSFFQVDATITGGQSGGVLVTQQGDVVGISTFYYRSFGLAGNVADAIDRINALLGNDTGIKINNRSFAQGEEVAEVDDKLLDKADVRRYILLAPKETEVTLTASGIGKPQIWVSKLAGYFIDGTKPENEDSQEVRLTFTVDEEVPYLVKVLQLSENPNDFVLTSTHSLLPYPDPDDRTELKVGDTYIGNIDTPDDTDVFSMTLKEGEVVELTLDTLSADPILAIDYNSDTLEESVSDKDSGGGIFGQNAQLVYKAPKDDTYRVLVENLGYSGDVGGYFLSVRKADRDAKVTKLDKSRQLIPSAFGKLAWYESKYSDLTFLYPIAWSDVTGTLCGAGATACFGNSNALLIIAEESLSQLPKKDRSQAGYVQLLLDTITSNPAVEVVSTEQITTLQRLAADRIDFLIQKGRVKASRITYVDEEGAMALSVSFVAAATVFDHSESVLRMIFDSIRVWKSKDQEGSAVYHLDEAGTALGAKKYQDALDQLTQAIALDPELMQAYALRAWVYQYQNEFESALKDIKQAVKLAPGDDSLYMQRSMMYWIEHDFTSALTDMEKVIELSPDKPEPLNQRALIYASLERYEDALADIDAYGELIDDALPPNVLDSRAYIYLKMGDYEKAWEDYTAILNQDWRSPYPLLGAGIVLVHNGEVEKGKALISEALDKFSQDSMEHPNPELMDLLNMKKAVLGE